MHNVEREGTSQTAAYVGKEMRTSHDVRHDIRTMIHNNFFPDITPYLRKFAKFLEQVKEVIEEKQDKHKICTDRHRHRSPEYGPGEPRMGKDAPSQ